MAYEITLFYVWLEDGYLNGRKIPNSRGRVESNVTGEYLDTHADPYIVADHIEEYLKRKGYKTFRRLVIMTDNVKSWLRFKAIAIGIIIQSFIPIYAFKKLSEEILSYLREADLTKPPIKTEKPQPTPTYEEKLRLAEEKPKETMPETKEYRVKITRTAQPIPSPKPYKIETRSEDIKKLMFLGGIITLAVSLYYLLKRGRK